MREFFSLDGAFNKYGTFVADTLILSIMWIIFSIPLITVGAATSAMFYVSTRRISDREGYITSDFWMAFKSNFVRSTLLWLLMFATMSVLIFNVWLMVTGEIANDAISGWMGFVLPAQFIFMVQFTFISIYAFPMTARFEMSFGQTLKNSFMMANRHFLTSLTCLVLLITVIVASMYTIIFTFAAPGVYAILSSYMIIRVFKKYRPEIDKDPRLEIAEIEAAKTAERRRKEFWDDAEKD